MWQTQRTPACHIVFQHSRNISFNQALTLTIVSKTQLVVGGTSANVAGDCLQLVFAVALFALGVTVAFQGIRKMFQKEVA